MALTSITSVAHAQSVAISNATIYTSTSQGVLTNATLVVDNGKITSINPATVSADITIDAQGKVLTPGFIGTMNTLGLVEVSAVAGSRDASEKKADMTFDPSMAFNPLSTAIAYARKGGITTNVVVPQGGESIFKGQAFVVNLTGNMDSVIGNQTALLVSLGAKKEGSRAFDLQELFNKFDDAQQALNKAKTKADKNKEDSDKEPKRDEKIINAVLAGTMPLLAEADRASDLLALIKLKQKFGLDVIIAGGADAVLVAKELSEAKIPVLIDAMRNLPGSFDSLHTSLESAAMLTKAGVKVVLSAGGAHNLYQLRFDAGNAVSNGLSKEQAINAVTKNVADVFNLASGSIAVGKNADLVLWSGDPFEFSSKVEKMWIDGEEQSTQSRHDKLRDRYMTKSTMPKAYTK